MNARHKTHPLKWPVAIALALVCLYLVFNIYTAGQPMWALGVLALCASGFFVYLANTGIAYRYLFPGLAAMAVFVAFPLLYTAQIGFTNYSSSNLLSEERAKMKRVFTPLVCTRRVTSFAFCSRRAQATAHGTSRPRSHGAMATRRTPSLLNLSPPHRPQVRYRWRACCSTVMC
jgi:hypothetical protein